MKKYCKSCEKEVKGTKKFSWLIFLLGLCTLGIVSVLYLLYYIIIKNKNKCPICGLKTISMRKHRRIQKKIDDQECIKCKHVKESVLTGICSTCLHGGGGKENNYE